MRTLLTAAVLVAAEITLLLVAARAVGVLALLAVIAASAALGAWVLVRQSPRAWRDALGAARERRPVEAELAEAAVLIVAGVLLLVPGLLTSAAGLVLLVAPVRHALARRFAARAVRAGSARFGRRLGVGVVAPGTAPAAPPGGGAGTGPSTDRPMIVEAAGPDSAAGPSDH